MRIISCASSCFIVSSATPITIRSEVPPKKKLALGLVDQDRRQRRDRGQEQRSREGQPGEDAVEELGRGRPGRTPGMNPPYFFRLSAWSTGLNVTAV